MIIRIYNTLTRKKEIFNPIKIGRVKIYVCGPTVYDSCHIGHARSAVVFDVIVKYFRNFGLDVLYVRNFTDIDDKIINRSKKTGLTYLELSQKYINEFNDDMKALNVSPPDAEPRVTDHITDVINIVKILIRNKSAYVKNGDVYFAVDGLDSYGKLSGRNKEDMIAGSRIKINKNKQNPLDFTIWKASKDGEPSWQSPWGDGRPGWHIECSAMNNKLLGKTIDIHGGGEDLIFPHHENEIAQSESAYKVPLANYWMHNGLVNINSEKMSKSLGNWKSVKDVIKSYHPEAVRLFLLSNHYRSPIDFSHNSLESYEKALTKIYRTIQRANNLKKIIKRKTNNKGPLWNDFCVAMNDDFNTARSIGILFNAVKKINRIMDNTSQIDGIKCISEIVNSINDMLLIGKILGILNLSPEKYLAQKTKSIFQEENSNFSQIETLIAERKTARADRNWKKADRIRNQLFNMGVAIEDRLDGTDWKFIN